jgi:glycerol-3-phosphate dehydrogenase
MAITLASPTLEHLADAELDVLVVGGGITGACIALEAATRGLRTALVDRGDFAEGATANCLRIVHGGLRYLQHFDLRRSRASSIERSVWLRSAPHLVEPLPVVVPAYRGGYPPRWLLAGALAVNEVLSADRNRGVDPDRRLPRARILSRRECVDLVPELDGPGLTGGVLFYDALMYSPERLTLAVLAAARAAGAVTANHVTFEAATIARGRVSGGRLRDTLTGAAVECQARWIVNATGAQVGEVAARLTGMPAVVAPGWSVALNLVTRLPASGPAFMIAGGTGDPDRVAGRGARQLVVVPWRGQRLVGTAHLPATSGPAPTELPDDAIERFLAEVRTAVPAIALSREDIALVQWGILPALASGGNDGVRLLKQHQVVDHAADGVAGALSVVSVKFTTARSVATDVVNRMAGGAQGPHGATGHPRLPLESGAMTSMASLLAEASSRHGTRLPGDVLNHLVRCYGSQYHQVLALGDSVAGWDSRVVADAPVIFAQLVHGAIEEQARTAADLVWRRTELGARGLDNQAAREAAARALAITAGRASA